MSQLRNPAIPRTISALFALCLAGLPAQAKYSGGSGVLGDAYQIATAADLIALGNEPNDYDKHFILTADIDLDPNLPGRKIFDKAVIGCFTGIFDGNDHAITHLAIVGKDYLGLFAQVAQGHQAEPAPEIRSLRVEGVNIVSSGNYVGALAGWFNGTVLARSSSSGKVNGNTAVGGLVGYVGGGTVTECHSVCTVVGVSEIGGLVGENSATLRYCHSTGSTNGNSEIGGLVGLHSGFVIQSYSNGMVNGNDDVGGLIGCNGLPRRGRERPGSVDKSYSTADVSGGTFVGGLVGWKGWGPVNQCYSVGAVAGNSWTGGLIGLVWTSDVTASFWDSQVSGITTSDGGAGKTTAEMQMAKTFTDAGWDFVGETKNGTEDIWWIEEGKNYPRLSWEPRKYGGGTGEPNDPYLIFTAEQMNAIGAEPNDWGKCFKLMADIDLSGFDGKDGRPAFNIIAPDTDPNMLYYQGTAFSGVFDGGGHKLSHLTIKGTDYVALFAQLESTAAIHDLGIEDVNVTGSGDFIAALAAECRATITHCYSTGVVNATGKVGERAYNVGGLIASSFSDVTFCHSTATVIGGVYVGGLMGSNWGIVTQCYSTGSVSGGGSVGGLIGENLSIMTRSYALGPVEGESYVGGLVGENYQGQVTDCYSTGAVSGGWYVGGLVGQNGAVTDAGKQAAVTRCYSGGRVEGQNRLGGLVGWNSATVTASFWDTQTSGQTTSAGGTGKITTEMQKGKTFLDAGWDFVGETTNGTEDIWSILEGKGYPRLSWERSDEAKP